MDHKARVNRNKNSPRIVLNRAKSRAKVKAAQGIENRIRENTLEEARYISEERIRVTFKPVIRYI